MNRSVALSLLVLFLLLSVIPATFAKECALKKGMRAWKHGGGWFVREGITTTWHETDNSGNRIATFVEQLRQEGQVVIVDTKRDMQVLLRSDVSGVRHGSDGNFNQLHSGKFVQVVDCT